MENNYFLALTLRKGDYKLIDISKLVISQYQNITGLAAIDSFTKRFTEEEIINSIKEANIVDKKYLKGKLVIQDNNQHKPSQVLSKDYIKDFDLITFLITHIDNKQIMNNIIYKLSILEPNKIIIENIKLCLKAKDIVSAINIIIYKINYNIQRKFMLYLIDLNEKENIKKGNKNKKVLLKDKVA